MGYRLSLDQELGISQNSPFIYWNGQNGLKMVWNGLKKDDVEWFDFMNFEVV